MSLRPIVCAGEAIVDFLPLQRGRLADVEAFERHLGGAAANVAAGAAILGSPAAYAWSVGDDEFGAFLLDALSRRGVDVSRAVRTRQGPTGISFIALDARGDRSFVGYGRPPAERFFRPEEVPEDLAGGAAVVHFTSNTLCADPAQRATQRFADLAAAAGRPVSFDPNLRPHLWDDPERMRDVVRAFCARATILKVSESEARMLTGEAEPGRAARALRALGAGLVVVTLAERGAAYLADAAQGHAPAPAVPVVDATGAGDAFVAGFLHSLRPHLEAGEHPAKLGGPILHDAVSLGCRVGAACVTRLGAASWSAVDIPPISH